MIGAIWDFIVAGLWFWTVMGIIICLTMWVPVLLDPRRRALFSDEALSKGLIKRNPDEVDRAVHSVFANRVGVVLLTFIAWPAFLYLMIFRPNGSGRGR